MEIFAVCVITFEPINIQICSSLQKDFLNLSFVKYIKVIGKKPTRFGHKMDFCKLQRPNMSRKFDTPPSIRRKRQGRKFCLLQRSVNSTLGAYRSISPVFLQKGFYPIVSFSTYLRIGLLKKMLDWPYRLDVVC